MNCHPCIGQVGGVDEAAQRVGDLAGTEGVRVGVVSIFQVPEQMLHAQREADAGEGVVVAVPVVHDHGAAQVAVDKLAEGGQVPVVEDGIGEQVRAGDLQVVLACFGPGPARSGVASSQTTRSRMISDRIACSTRRPPGRRAPAGCAPTRAGPDPGHRLQDVSAAYHGHVLHHQQEHAQGLEVQPVAHRARRARRLWRSVRDVPAAAGALHSCRSRRTVTARASGR